MFMVVLGDSGFYYIASYTASIISIISIIILYDTIMITLFAYTGTEHECKTAYSLHVESCLCSMDDDLQKMDGWHPP